MSSPTRLSDFGDDLLPNNELDDDKSDNGGYASDEAIEDNKFDEDTKEGDGDPEKRKIDPSTSQKRRILNPQPRLDAERLKGPKGLHTIEKHFENFKFHGKGYEKKDLDTMMKKLEYWSHRMFPKLEFDDFLGRLEVLGTKKAVQTHIKRIRLDLLTDEDVVVNDSGDEEPEIRQDSMEPMDQFDALISEELEKQKQLATPQRPDFPSLATGTPRVESTTPVEITQEMKERMEKNRQIAIQKRLARIEAEEAKKRNLEHQDGVVGIPVETEIINQTQEVAIQDAIITDE